MLLVCTASGLRHLKTQLLPPTPPAAAGRGRFAVRAPGPGAHSHDLAQPGEGPNRKRAHALDLRRHRAEGEALVEQGGEVSEVLIRMPAPNSVEWSGRERPLVSSMLWESMPTSFTPRSWRYSAASAVKGVVFEVALGRKRSSPCGPARRSAPSRLLMFSKPGDHLRGVGVGREDGVEDMLDHPVAKHEGEPLDQGHPVDGECRQPQS